MAVHRITPESALLLICDVQERFRTAIYQMDHVIATTATLARGAEEFGIPVVVTEQNPKALGKTVGEVQLGKLSRVFEKEKFSMCTSEVETHFRHLNRSQVLICGVETHVCVQQTALDLLTQGYQVFIVTDGVSSQRALDRSAALSLLQASGARLTSMESVFFELMRGKDCPQFKSISGLIKEAGKLPCEVRLSSL
mmetsp:Transcript_5658/g.13466  ORF Transcript_5658/g.13466 Transcript_5658/m.13466 type:complete len:196 (+) Transcript_5658:49-636(+)